MRKVYYKFIDETGCGLLLAVENSDSFCGGSVLPSAAEANQIRRLDFTSSPFSRRGVAQLLLHIFQSQMRLRDIDTLNYVRGIHRKAGDGTSLRQLSA